MYGLLLRCSHFCEILPEKIVNFQISDEMIKTSHMPKSFFCLINAANPPNWTHCEICVEKYFTLTQNYYWNNWNLPTKIRQKINVVNFHIFEVCQPKQFSLREKRQPKHSSYGFTTTWRWTNDDRRFTFRWTLLKSKIMPTSPTLQLSISVDQVRTERTGESLHR